ncbi:MAG: response regulator transcription factor [Myxococcales bacterium]|jgi:DNA-binding NarL/FixJ family response regulator
MQTAMQSAREGAGSPESAAGDAAPSPTQPLRLLLVDDHPVLRAGLRSLLSAEPDFDVVAEADSGEGAVVLAREVRPDLVLLDFSLPGMTGAEAARAIREEAPLVRLLAISVHDEIAIVRRLLESGADGYILKRSGCDELVQAVRTVAAGGTYLDPKLPRQPARPGHGRDPLRDLKVEVLSAREAEVARLLAQGLTVKEIAQQLNLSPRTLESYRARAMEKLSLKSRADLIRYAIRRGWPDAD